MNYGLTRLTPAVKFIAIALTVIFVIDKAAAALSGRDFLLALFALILKPYKFSPIIWAEIWRPFTYTLLHQNLMHLLGNLIGFVFLGAALEDAIGTARFVRLYIITGLIGGLCALGAGLLGYGGDFLIGASACAMGVTIAFITLYPQETIMLWLIVLIPVKALYLGIILAVIQLASLGSADGVSYIAHIGGMIAGFIMAKYSLYGDCFSREWLEKQKKKAKLRRFKVVGSDGSAANAETHANEGAAAKSSAKPKLTIVRGDKSK
ncbi:MAG: rhomboid family intramembrane serine protease [bacterium]|nr:rhomboid family intramembrane serine protease [bacterium]